MDSFVFFLEKSCQIQSIGRMSPVFCFLSGLSCKLQDRQTFMSIRADAMKISWLKKLFFVFGGKGLICFFASFLLI